MNTLEQQLNTAIETHGFRISPRLPFRERLARYVEKLYAELDSDEAEAVAGLVMLRHSNEGENIRVTIQNNETSHRYTLRPRIQISAATGTHPMTRRSQSKSG
jgi:hypothetical protein